jgi:hypothetical protein
MNKRFPVKFILTSFCHFRHLFSAIMLMVMLMGNAIAQKEDKIKVILEGSEIKKIEKADASLESAKALMKEVNLLNQEISAVEGNPDLEDKTKMKKVKQLEGQARQKIYAASDLYLERNRFKYKLYKTYIEKFWLQFEGDEASYEEARKIEEQSNDLYYQAVTNRAEANKMPAGYEMIQKIKQAIEFENMAIDRQLTVLGLYYDIDLTDKKTEPVIAAQTAPLVAVADTEMKANSEQPQPGVRQTEVIPQEPAIEQTLAATAGSESLSALAKSNVEFRIQLAASRTQLTKDNIAKLCPKPYQIDRSEENGWYKYYIAAGDSYDHAKKVLRECGVEKAFIVPYKNGLKITIAEASQTNP